MPNNLLFHHIGVACRPESFDRGREQRHFELLGYKLEGEVWVDERLGMSGQFMVGPAGAPRIELVVPHGPKSPVTPWLEQKVKLYHMAYLTGDLEREIERLRGERAKVMFPPTPAVAFGDRSVAFLMLPNMMLVEIIERD